MMHPRGKSTSASEAARRRESGQPGGGAGRIDDVRGSRVFPASHADGARPDAAYHGLSSWGQGERGAAGYEDHGDSELELPRIVGIPVAVTKTGEATMERRTGAEEKARRTAPEKKHRRAGKKRKADPSK